jgi:hypothetical protein
MYHCAIPIWYFQRYLIRLEPTPKSSLLDWWKISAYPLLSSLQHSSARSPALDQSWLSFINSVKTLITQLTILKQKQFYSKTYPPGTRLAPSWHTLLARQADLSRYLATYFKTGDEDIRHAFELYRLAILASPNNGSYYALVANVKKGVAPLDVIYFYCRALCVKTRYSSANEGLGMYLNQKWAKGMEARFARVVEMLYSRIKYVIVCANAPAV